jgi:hypothetical protein
MIGAISLAQNPSRDPVTDLVAIEKYDKPNEMLVIRNAI